MDVSRILAKHQRLARKRDANEPDSVSLIEQESARTSQKKSVEKKAPIS